MLNKCKNADVSHANTLPKPKFMCSIPKSLPINLVSKNMHFILVTSYHILQLHMTILLGRVNFLRTVLGNITKTMLDRKSRQVLSFW